MRKSSVPFWAFAVLIQIGFFVLTLLARGRKVVFGPDPEGFYVLLSTNITFLILWVGVKTELVERAIRNDISNLRHEVELLRASRPGVTPLVDREFYEKFGAAIRDASVGVAMTHLDTHPPNRARKTDAGDYYASLPKIVKANSTATFRRVERASAEKRVWLEELVKNFEGIPNFSLGVLALPTNERRSGLLSVQVIDNQHAVLVAVAEHDSSLGPRDIWIQNPLAASLFARYYDDMLWGPALKVIESGRVNESELKKVREFIEKQCPNT